MLTATLQDLSQQKGTWWRAVLQPSVNQFFYLFTQHLQCLLSTRKFMTQPRPWLRSEFSLFHTLGSQTGTMAANHVSSDMGQGLWNWTEAHQTSNMPSDVKDFKLLPALLQRWKFHPLWSTSWSNPEMAFTASFKLRDLTFWYWSWWDCSDPILQGTEFISQAPKNLLSQWKSRHRHSGSHTPALLPLHCLLGLSGAEALAMQDCSLWSLQWKRNWSC